jgi:hypothetical protein
MNPADVVAHANSDMNFPGEALEAAALILHMLEHGYGDDQVDAAHEHWSGYPETIRRSGREDAARVLRAALGGAGLVVVAACHCGNAIGDCHSCAQPRCYYCDPGLGKHHRPMKCNERHAPPVALSERNAHA